MGRSVFYKSPTYFLFTFFFMYNAMMYDILSSKTWPM